MAKVPDACTGIDADANGGVFVGIPTAVPEPGTWAGGALLVGAAGLTLRRRRSRRA